ncbi:tRNA (adenosine(37)-N6)-threonylcarbamoyltransferase complex dimerization subunit type 1 TsaB [Aphanothece sacrum]|uniref:Peptidase n=1 Tax=Aphanothece sacrum FPU1 TaxID=1920663 RepID=A0A401ILF0_APHSA|nr:tRNA (adenosine(37)-N6)-threonylcarbamoyltransferase complex dimerization subunit type 1 TsaB [Aphanothece sacrum]GBF82075.1 peptidase [Aphanothece sacrum FPU1]GBF85009.1 peptidase [Aphanothece sacrum FPU3]
MELYGLALHTTSSQLGLGLSNFLGEITYQTWDIDRELSNYLHLHLQEFIKPKTWQNLEYIVVAKGPGSFTSTRIGVVTARTLAQQLNLPLLGISTLKAFAWSQKDNYSPHGLIPVQMKASQGKLYVAIYQLTSDEKKLITYLEDQVMTPETWQQTLEKSIISHPPAIASEQLGITVQSLLELGYNQWQQGESPHWSEIMPFYGMSVTVN